MISTVRGEFEQGKKDLEAAEERAVEDYRKLKEDYQKDRADLVNQLSRLTVELQQAESNLDQYQQDLKENQDEVAAAKAYLAQLGASCNSLLEHYDERVKMRKEEKEAIKKAVKMRKEEKV